MFKEDKEMILISVKSNVVDAKRQFTTDNAAMKYLKTINRLHHAHRMKIAGHKPKKIWFRCGVRSISNARYNEALTKWNETLASCITLRVDIINTRYNQLNMAI